MQSKIHQSVIKRLFMAWLALSSMIATLVYFYEHGQIDALAVNLAQAHANTLTDKQIRGISTLETDIVFQLQAKVEDLTRRQFLAADIYDVSGTHVAASFNFRSAVQEHEIQSRHHKFPLDGTLHHEKFTLNEARLIQVLIPLNVANGQTLGYFEGVFSVDDKTLELINERIYYSVSMVILICLITGIVLYPVILRLNKELFRFSENLLHTNIELMEVLGCAIASRDSSTNSHNYRVTLYALRLAERLRLPARQLQDIIVGSFLHDVGKIGVDDSILKKKGSLTENEIALMQEHVKLGIGIVQKSKWLRSAQEIIAYHHEKYDGTGYGKALSGDEIPLNARIFAIADVFDALVSERVYKKAYDLEQALKYIRDQSGKHFDPALVDIFMAIAEKLYNEIDKKTDDELAALLTYTIGKYFYSPDQITLYDEKTDQHFLSHQLNLASSYSILSSSPAKKTK